MGTKKEAKLICYQLSECIQVLLHILGIVFLEKLFLLHAIRKDILGTALDGRNAVHTSKLLIHIDCKNKFKLSFLISTSVLFMISQILRSLVTFYLEESWYLDILHTIFSSLLTVETWRF